MKVELRNLSAIHPYANNPRMNEPAVAAVARSIQEFGFRQPIVVDPSGVIVVGHTRYLAALRLGLKKVPVHVARDLTPAQLKAYRIADNKTAELAEWDHDRLAEELMELQGMDLDLDVTGLPAEELTELLDAEIGRGLVDPDDVPAPPDQAISQLGDLWLLGEHRLLCGDAGQARDVDRLVAGARIQFVHTDPPYNVKVEPRSNNAMAAGLSSFAPYGRRDTGSHPPKAQPTHQKLRAKDRPLINAFVAEEEFERLLRAWFGNLARILEPGRCFLLWGGYGNLGNYPPALKECGLYFSQAIVWDKEWPVLTRKDFLGSFELAFYGWKK